MNLLQKSFEVLDKNWFGKYTIPANGLYPFQWNWDSGFIALGWLHYKPERALVEMETLFSGQWKNGFLPHILFHDYQKHSTYFPSADYWDSSASPFASDVVRSSGITQPPVHGIILEAMYNRRLDVGRIEKLYDQTVDYHQWLYANKAYKDTGLMAIWHNWESGMDNSVIWDDVFSRIPQKILDRIEFSRKDVNQVENSAETRPKNSDYKGYLYLLNELKDRQFQNVGSDYPFQVLEPVFNTILIQASRSLIRLGKKLNRDVSTLEQQLQMTESHFDHYFWSAGDHLYYPFDVVLQEKIYKKYIGNYFPIYASLPDLDRVKGLLRHIDLDLLQMFPSVTPGEIGFEPKNYWRGPVWINMNWMIWKGLKIYKLNKVADRLKESTLDLVQRNGFYEYFNPFKNETSNAGYGGADFSWTAALVIDFIKDDKE